MLLFSSIGSALGQRLLLTSVAPKETTYLKINEADSVVIFDHTASGRILPIHTNLNYVATSSASWCHATSTEKGLNIAVDPNATLEKRTAQIDLAAKDNQHYVINISQLGTAPMVISREKIVTIADGVLDFKLEITANVDFTIHAPEWVKIVDPTPLQGTHLYTFHAEPLKNVGNRMAEITLNTTNGIVRIPVKQIFNGYPRFAVISDLHFGNKEGEGPMVKVPRALKNLFSKTPQVDALFICGDLTDGGKAEQYDDLEKVFSDHTVIPEGQKIYFMMGDHDNYDTNGLQNYYRLGQPLYQFIDIKGYPFITLSIRGSRGYDGYGDEEKAYLEKALKDAADKYPGKPIFLFTHVPPYNTVYGSCPGEGGWGTQLLSSILNKYPQIVMFSGHSHFPLGDPRSINQQIFTSINEGSTTYSEIEPNAVEEGIHPYRYNYVTEGVIVTADSAMNLEIERWDTYNNEEILPRWQVLAPHDGSRFIYKNRDGGERPLFAAGDGVIVTNLKDESCDVSFPQATDDEVVHHYLVEIVDDKGTVYNTYRRFSDFYLNSYKSLTFTIQFSGIPLGAELVARVKAVDSYNNESEPLVSESFRTSDYIPNPDVPKPVASLLDISFGEEGKVTDLSPLGVDVLSGSETPVTQADDKLGLHFASFSGDKNCFYRVDYGAQEAMKEAFKNGFTFEVLYSPDNTNNVCIMSAQENGCAGIEQASGGQIQFYAFIGGSYRILKSSVKAEEGKFYHVVATYDKNAQKTYIYIDGMPAGEIDAPGSLTFPSDERAHWIAIGGDAGVNGYAQYSLEGKIAIARMYDKPVTRDEAYWLFKGIGTEKNHAK